MDDDGDDQETVLADSKEAAHRPQRRDDFALAVDLSWR
jgi:hypothetical protein